jgi:hypothetical protein
MEIDKNRLVDSTGRPLTQSLFLEIGYTDFAVFTLKEQDFDYNGKLLPSLKRLYLELEDPTEYEFANTYLLGWRHWKRMNENKILKKHFEEWREELEYRMRSKGVRSLLKSATNGNFQAAKFFVDRGWEKRQAGRPSKAELEKEKAFQERVSEEYGGDVVRLFGEG